MNTRERLSSRLGFLMLAAGCAVGLGNVWRFPFIVGQNGGGAFVVLYLAFLALFGLPLLTAELAEGRGAQQGLASAMRILAPSRWARAWGLLGTVIFAGNFLLMIYYTDVAGWLVRYTAGYVSPALMPSGPDVGAVFGAVVGDKFQASLYMAFAVGSAALVCMGGVVKSVERVTKWMMIALLGLLALLALKSLTLPGAIAGVKFYLVPDLARFLQHPWKAVFEAMGQAFFTLSLGVGCMTIFGSYIDRDHTLVKESVYIIVIDTFVALMSGLVIFPACASCGVDVTGGPGLIFMALPQVFAQMAGGRVWGGVFFLFLTFAALTTVITVFECLIGGLMDMTGKSRRRISAFVGGGVVLASLPCVLFDGVLDWEDFFFSNLWLPLGAMASCIFCTRSFGWGWNGFRAEASAGRGPAVPRWLRPVMRYLLPLGILTIVAVGLYDRFR